MACVTFQCLAGPALVPSSSCYCLSDPKINAFTAHLPFQTWVFTCLLPATPTSFGYRTLRGQAESLHQPVLHTRTLGQLPR